MDAQAITIGGAPGRYAGRGAGGANVMAWASGAGQLGRSRSRRRTPTHVDGPEPEWFSWEVERFCELVLKSNPNLLEVLHSPLVVRQTPLGEDVDLRGVHMLPAAEVVGLRHGPETLDRTWFENEAEVDLVTHDLAKFARLMLRRNGYVLEQVLSPLVVLSTPEHAELVALAKGCITKWHAHHYRGIARTQWEFFEKKRELKPLLYTFRVLLTGINLMRTGVVQAAAKAEAEHVPLEGPPLEQLAADVLKLQNVLDEAEAVSSLPDRPSAEPELHELLLKARLSR